MENFMQVMDARRDYGKSMKVGQRKNVFSTEVWLKPW
jgi:hypothetical protein